MTERKQLTPEEIAELAAIGAQAEAQRHTNPRGPNYGETVPLPDGKVVFVTLEPRPCDGHEIDDDWGCCKKCGLSVWRM